MKKKSIFITLAVVIVIIIALKGWDWKVQHDKEQAHFNIQKERVTLFMKYNVKNYKSITFTETEINPMGTYVLVGYINGDKKLEFIAEATSASNFQFDGNIGWSGELDKLFPKKLKDVTQIEKELEKKETKKFKNPDTLSK